MFSIAFLFFSLISHNLGAVEIPKNCTAPGPFCETCHSHVICFRNSDGSWTKKDRQKCGSHEICTRGECTANPDPPDPFCDGTADLDVPCRSPGIFPHPFYCDKFVLCVDYDGLGHLRSYTHQCEGGCGYNMASGLCDKQLSDGGCEPGVYPVLLCTEEGYQNEALSENQALFCDCEQYSQTKKVLYPFLDRCPCGGKYSNYGCSSPSSSTTAQTSSSSITGQTDGF